MKKSCIGGIGEMQLPYIVTGADTLCKMSGKPAFQCCQVVLGWCR